MATKTPKKKSAATTDAMSDLFEGRTVEEQKAIIARMKRMALNMRNVAEEFSQLVVQLETPKPTPTKNRVDGNGDPEWRYLVRVPIPEDIRLTPRLLEYAVGLGYTQSDARGVFANAVEYYKRTGTKWQDWTMVIQKWFRTEMARRKDQGGGAPPRTSRTLPEFK
jgi:hypothetical protein